MLVEFEDTKGLFRLVVLAENTSLEEIMSRATFHKRIAILPKQYTNKLIYPQGSA